MKVPSLEALDSWRICKLSPVIVWTDKHRLYPSIIIVAIAHFLSLFMHACIDVIKMTLPSDFSLHQEVVLSFSSTFRFHSNTMIYYTS